MDALPVKSQKAIYPSLHGVSSSLARAPSPDIPNAEELSSSSSASKAREEKSMDVVVPHFGNEDLSGAGDLYVVEEECFHDGNRPVMRRQTAIADYFFGADGSQSTSAPLDEKPAWIRDSILSLQSVPSQILMDLTQDVTASKATHAASTAQVRDELLKEIERACTLRAIEREQRAQQNVTKPPAPAGVGSAEEKEERRRQIQQDSHQLDYYFHTNEDKLSLQQLERSVGANPTLHGPPTGLCQHAVEEDQPNLLWLMDGAGSDHDDAEDTAQAGPSSGHDKQQENFDTAEAGAAAFAYQQEALDNDDEQEDDDGSEGSISDDVAGVRAGAPKHLPRSTSFC
jgi:hypothetical protein